jgi:hypothetical protein
MKVVYKDVEQMKLECIPYGEIFLLGNKLYMLIDDTNLPTYQSYNLTILDLSSYATLTADPETLVTKVRSKLVIG